MTSITALGAGHFPLRINDVSGVDTPWPIVASLPFARGELDDATAIRIVSGGSEIPSQVDVSATWPDGSIRWALAGYTAPLDAQYSVEYGEGVARGAHPTPLRVTRDEAGGFVVDTGPAVYQFDGDKLLPEHAWLVFGNERRPILRHSGAGAYLLDNFGRKATVAGPQAEIDTKVLKEGPARLAVKRSGWYITDDGSRVARADLWLYFAAGTPYVKMTHAIIFTEDTNQLWAKDFGLDFATPSGPRTVYCAQGVPGTETVRAVPAEAGGVYLLQDTYPHFAERESRAVIGTTSAEGDTVFEEVPVAGDWAHGDYGDYGITLVMPWLAERFPKELFFGQEVARASFWSARSGRELDFRGKTLVREYWQSWAEKGFGSPGIEKLSEWPSDASGSARTHDLWFLPHIGPYRTDSVARTAVAAARQPLVMADPERLCATDAMGHPMHHRDTANFADIETLLSEYWTRFVLPLKVFPFTGFLSWGQVPLWYYMPVDGKVMGRFHILSFSDPYGAYRTPWYLYARSGERTYYDYGYRFNRFMADWDIARWDTPSKEKGWRTTSNIQGWRNVPFIWGNATIRHIVGQNGIGNWLAEYYLTGDESAKDLVMTVKAAHEKHLDIFRSELEERGTGLGRQTLRTLLNLSMVDHEGPFTALARQAAHAIVDMNSQNGLSATGYGALYKDHKLACFLSEYHFETGDELVREALIKLMDQRYRFDRRYNPLGHKNYDCFTNAVAYWLSGDERFYRVVEQTLSDMLYYSRAYALSAVLEKFPGNPLDWPNLTEHLSITDFMNPFIGIPSALRVMAREGRRGKRTPMVIKSLDTTKAEALFQHRRGTETRIGLYFTTLRQGVMPRVFAYPHTPGDAPLADIAVELQERVQWPERLVTRPEVMVHASIGVPAETPEGLYVVSLQGNEPFTVLDVSGDQAALYCPEGFWTASTTPIRRSGEGPYGRAGEGVPMFFTVPEGLKELDLFLGSPARLKRPDGSIALELSAENVGRQAVAVDGHSGVWSIEPYFTSFRGACPPAFFRLLNVEPVVAFGCPDLLPEQISGHLEADSWSLGEPERALEFVAGVEQQAVRLSRSTSLVFPKGKSLDRGGHEYFPGETGTVEFWFNAGRNVHEHVVLPLGTVDLPFVTAPHILLRHRFWNTTRDIFTIHQLELVTQKGIPEFGYQSSNRVRAGQWTHFAFCWDLRRTDAGAPQFAIFVDGEPQPFNRAPYGVARGMNLPAQTSVLDLADEGENIKIGPFDGKIDMLRVSDTIRYTETFAPPKQAPALDAATRVLFCFDGTLEGISACAPEPVQARTE